MNEDRWWRSRIESFQRAGLEYIDAARLAPPTVNDVSQEGDMPRARSKTSLSETTAIEDAGVEVGQPALSMEEKLAELTILRSEVAACNNCSALCGRTQTVFSDGSPMAELCFIGEAPGADEDAQGVPFVGRAGQLLTKIIEACGMKRDEVYICNVLKCRPPDNRNPEPDEIANCRPFLNRQLDLVKPKIMVALGKFAAAHLMGVAPADVPILRLRGTIKEYRGIPYMITLHPAYLLRNPSAKKDVWEDMKEVMRRLGRPVEESSTTSHG